MNSVVKTRAWWLGGLAAAVIIFCGAAYTFFYVMTPTQPTRFDVSDFTTSQESTKALFGSYPIETSEGRKFAWVGPTAKIKLPLKGSWQTLKISGYSPFSLHRKWNNVAELVVSVWANGLKVGEMRFDKDESFERAFPLTDIVPDKWGDVEIELKSSSIVEPTETDNRRLAFVVTKIVVE
jgi:hypothetical protein